MHIMGIEDTIRRLMSDIFRLEPEKLAGNVTPKTVERWDSLAHIKLMLALEKEFKIRIPDEEVVTLASFADITTTVHRLAAG